MKTNKKLTPIQIETSIIHISNSFLSLGMSIETYQDTLIKDTDSDYTKVLKKILQDLSKKSLLFKKKVDSNIALACDIFEDLETKIKKEILHPKPRGRFNKQCRLSSSGDLEANGVLLAVMLICEHRYLPTRKLHLQYKLADDVIYSLRENKTKAYENARILAKRYVKELHKL